MSSLGEEIRNLAAEGVGHAEIMRRLGVASSTVGHHLRAPAQQRPEALEQPPADSVISYVRTREAVADLLAQDVAKCEIARRLGVSKATVSYHARRLGAEVDQRGARRYDWAAIQAYYDAGHSVDECRSAFGFSKQTWHAAKNRGAITTRPSAMPIDALCRKGVPRNRRHIRMRLIAAGLKQERCERCGCREWRGLPIPLELHHVNGDRDDNRLENLELLCPNCHALTENHSGRRRPEAA